MPATVPAVSTPEKSLFREFQRRCFRLCHTQDGESDAAGGHSDVHDLSQGGGGGPFDIHQNI